MRLLVLLFCLIGLKATAQTFEIKGNVSDIETGEAIAFANISIKNTAQGTSADIDGNYLLKVPAKDAILVFSVIGYETKEISFIQLEGQKGLVKLKLSSVNLDEIVVKANENPAFAILRKAIANKNRNNPDQFDSYQAKVYHQLQFDMNHFTDKIKKNFLFKPFDFAFNFTKTTEDSINYLPFLLKEKLENQYHQKNPVINKTIIEAEREVKFFEGPKTREFIDDLYITPNVYQNYIEILGKKFPSPLNNNYKSNYDFTLAESMEEKSGHLCYHILFKPKGDADVAFYGDMFIENIDFAVKYINLNFSIEANVNYVRSYHIAQDYEQIDQQHWFMTRSDVLADFTVIENIKNLTGFFGKKTSIYDSIIINQSIDLNQFKRLDNVSYAEDATQKTENFWLENRKKPLEQEQREIEILVDSMKQAKKFNTYKTIFNLLGNGYIPYKEVEIGNVFTFINFNKIESVRLKFGIKSAREKDENFYWKLYTAYGFKDKRAKYYAEIRKSFLSGFHKNNFIGLSYYDDIEQPGRTLNTIELDHLLTFTFNKSYQNRFYSQKTQAYYERQWTKGFASQIGYRYQNLTPVDERKLYADDNYRLQNHLGMHTAYISLKYCHKLPLIHADYHWQASHFFAYPYPLVSLELSNTYSNFIHQKQYHFYNVSLQINHTQKLPKIGYTVFQVEASKNWGETPYPYLHYPTANQGILNDYASFNLMNYMEYAADQWFSLIIEHHFDGFVFNKIPYVNKAKLRLFVFGKLYYGSLSHQNKTLLIHTNNTFATEKPYAEVGFGIENILKISRVDFSWRIDKNRHDNTYRFIAKPSFYFKF